MVSSETAVGKMCGLMLKCHNNLPQCAPCPRGLCKVTIVEADVCVVLAGAIGQHH